MANECGSVANECGSVANECGSVANECGSVAATLLIRSTRQMKLYKNQLCSTFGIAI